MQDLLELAVGKMQQEVMLRITDEKNRYLHWDKTGYLKVSENFDNIEQYWHFVKFSRMQQQKNYLLLKILLLF
ncbi:hypothetical protein [Abyssogena phaseoliformis symbiont]|uniref:hypothetical protein n=1 Tax=Abyssogena phaseoliformis symbiont TaxID=596095 RepID=UPI001CEC4134|nr:hypothetical protein [Abyssogena phaseoliformis symbiont]